MEPLNKRLTIILAVPILIAGFVFLYFNLFYLPDVPIHLHVDQVTLLFDAKRMFHGEMIYRDFFQFTLPATQVFYLLVFKIFGVRTWIPNAMLIVLGLGMMALIIVISRKVLSGVWVMLPAVLFLIIPFRSQFDATHHWYSTLLVLAALAVLMEKRTRWWRLAAAGGLLGLSTCFTQSRGLPAAVGVALFLIWEARKRGWTRRQFWMKQLHLWWGFFAVLIGFNAYFVWKVGLGKFLSDTLLFCLRYYPTFDWNTYRVYMIDIPRYHPWYRLPALAIWLSIHLLIPLIYLLFFARYWDNAWEQPDEPWDRLMLLSFTGCAIFLGIVAAPSWLRICAVSPPGVILFVWFWSTPGRFENLRAKAIWMLVLLVALGECVERELRWHKDLDLPVGRMAMINHEQYDEMQYFLQRTKPGEYFFGDEMYNYLLNLRDPARVPYVVGSNYTRPAQAQNLLEGLKKYPVKFVLWDITLDMPPPPYGGKNHLGPVRNYLKTHYHVVKVFPEYTMVWERNAEAPPAAGPQPAAGSPPPGIPHSAASPPSAASPQAASAVQPTPSLPASSPLKN